MNILYAPLSTYKHCIGNLISLLSYLTCSFLISVVLRRTFHCRRGVRHSDPLSLLLFVLAADFLQSLINKGKDTGLLKSPIFLQATSDFPIIQYADETLINIEGDARQLFFLESVLNIFLESSGLQVNFIKSMMVPVSIYEQKLELLARTFGCEKGSMPFTYYLGLPLGITFECERILASVSTFLS